MRGVIRTSWRLAELGYRVFDHMFCPTCGRQYDPSETTCPDCDVALVPERPAGAPNPDATLVSVFETTDTAVLPLATMTLDEHGIEYSVEVDSTLAAMRHRPDVLDQARSDATHRIVVRQEDALRAGDLVADLVEAPPEAPAPGIDAPTPVVDLATGQPLGALTSAQSRFLIDALEEESPTETRYYVDPVTIDMLETKGADPDLVALLRRALGGRDGMEIRF
jgi:processive 1,2-diacylglycerol beta-glucosyltransferase